MVHAQEGTQPREAVVLVDNIERGQSVRGYSSEDMSIGISCHFHGLQLRRTESVVDR